MAELARSWTTTATVGGKYPSVDPVFFKDNNRVAVVTALALKLFLISTKQPIAKIPLEGSELTQLYLTSDESTFYIVRSDGSCATIGVSENEPVNLALDRKVVHIISNTGDQLLAVFATDEGLGIGYLTPGTEDDSLEELFFAKDADLHAVSPSKEYIVFASRKDKENTIIDTFHITTGRHIRSHRERRSHSIAISNKGLVAVGAPSGVIDVYYPKGVRTLKWHLEGVNALEFSLDDNYLISGGRERVLVFWQMDADKQQFLPRLDGEITKITINRNSTLYGVTLSNRQLVILSASDLISRLNVSGVKAYFSKSPADPEKEKRRQKKLKNKGVTPVVGDYTTSYTIHPDTRNGYFFSGLSSSASTVSTGPGCQVQVYNPIKDEQESVLTLAPTVQQGRVRREQLISDPNLTHLQFTADGQWMVTVDVKQMPPIDVLVSRNDVEINLKFWKLDRETSKWSLVSRVASPHGAGQLIMDLRCNPADHSVITAANDGSVRLWRPNPKTGSWMVRKVLAGTGSTSRAVALAWSADSSTVALGFETSVFLIDSKTFKVHSMLPNLLGRRVRGLEFLGNYLVALAKTRLVVWDLVSSRQMWSVKVQVPLNGSRLLAVDPQHNRIALAVNYWTEDYSINSRLVLFDVTSPVPVASLVHEHAVSALRLIPGTSGYSFIDSRGVINAVAGAAPVVEQQTQDLRRTLLALYNDTKAINEEKLSGQATSQSLDVNSFDNVFEGDNTTLDVLFERVLALVSPQDN